MSTWDRPALRDDLGASAFPLRRRRTARSWASREASNTDRIDCFRSSFMEATSAYGKNRMPYSGRSVNRTQYRQTQMRVRDSPSTSNRIKTNLDENVETPGAGN